MLNRLIILLIIFNSNFIFSLNNNEINGKFIYDVDIEKNELYVFDNEISLTTYDLTNDTIKSKYKFDAFEPDFNNATWNGFYTGEFSLSKSVMNGLMDNLVLKKSENEKFYIFHDGGGLVMSLSDGRLKRLDNSFPFMNKFLGILSFTIKKYITLEDMDYLEQIMPCLILMKIIPINGMKSLFKMTFLMNCHLVSHHFILS